MCGLAPRIRIGAAQEGPQDRAMDARFKSLPLPARLSKPTYPVIRVCERCTNDPPNGQRADSPLLTRLREVRGLCGSPGGDDAGKDCERRVDPRAPRDTIRTTADSRRTPAGAQCAHRGWAKAT